MMRRAETMMLVDMKRNSPKEKAGNAIKTGARKIMRS